MLHSSTSVRRFLLAIWLGLLPHASQGLPRKPLPTASLPIEPASADPEVFEEQTADPAPALRSAVTPPRPRSARFSEGRETSLQGGFLMTREGFGGQLRLLEYAASGLAVTQTLRYQSPAEEDAFFDKRYGLMLGLEIHPWRQARFSPLLAVQAGADRFLRASDPGELDLFGLEAAAGLELKLARAVSFLFQWTEVYYPGLKEQLFLDQKPRDRYAGSFQVFFNLRWDGVM